MKKLLLIAIALFAITANAQKSDCKITEATNEDGTIVRSTPEYMMYEKVFAGTSQFLFFSLTDNGGVPVLNVQLLAKSKDFPKAYCFDKTSKVYIQLNNGKIITLISALEEQCAGLVYDSAEKNNIRVLSGAFLFTKGSLEELEKTAISFIRIKFAAETVDYPIRKELQSEATSQKYNPENYFIDMLKCIQ